MFPSKAKVRQNCLNPTIKDLDSISSGFLNCNANPLYMYIHLGPSVLPWDSESKRKQCKHDAYYAVCHTISNKVLCL